MRTVNAQKISVRMIGFAKTIEWSKVKKLKVEFRGRWGIEWAYIAQAVIIPQCVF